MLFIPRFRRACATVLVLSAGGVALPGAAAERISRLVLDVKVNGQGSSGGSRIAEKLHTTVTLRSNGRLHKKNEADQAAAAAEGQKMARELEARRPPKEVVEARQKRYVAEAKACGSDLACLNKAGTEYQKDTAAWSPKYEQPTGEDRYMNFGSHRGCASDLHATIDTVYKGTIMDVQGPIPFSETTQADYRATPEDKQALCHAFTPLVVDVKEKKFYTSVGALPMKGKFTRLEGNRNPYGDNGPVNVRLHDGAMKWVREQLQGAPLQGTARTTLTYGKPGSGQSKVDVELSWRFEDL